MYHRLIPLLLASALCPGLSAQVSVNDASLTGRVSDASGAIIPKALVTVHALNTNLVSTVLTDPAGRFLFPYLQVGNYLVTIHMDGFSDIQRSLILTVGAAFALPVTLTPGAAEAVTVLAQPPVLESDRSQIAGTVSQDEVASLPFEGRNYLDLALLLPGVSPTNTASTQTLAETSEVPGQGYSINSQRNFSNSFIVDGLSDNDDAAGVAGNVFSLDVVREFQVVTSGGQAEFGRALGGYLNIVTRSGTSQLHGTAYGFLRNQRLNADNALSGGKLPLTSGQYGASLSGPIQLNRTFLFGNFEEQRLRTNGILTITPANAALINARLLAVGYAAPLLAIATGPTSQYPTTLHTDTAFLRGDHRFGQHDEFSMRYSLYKLSSLNARGNGSLNAVSNGTSVFATNHAVAFSNIATLSPRTFNETRGQFIYDSLNAPPNDLSGPTVAISGVATFGRSTSSPIARLNYLGELVDNLVLQRGAHTFKTGVDFLENNDSITFTMALRGSYSFSSLANFLSGTYNNQGYTQNFGTPVVSQNNPNIGFYFQDEWKAAPSLTLNAGVRYDLEYLSTIQTRKGNVSPRIGFAWSPYADRRTLLRGSYGLFYDRIPLRPLANALLSAHNTIDPNQAILLSYTFSPGQSGAPTFPNIAAAPPTGALENYSLVDQSIHNPYSQQTSLEVEQQLSPASTLGISYQHLRGEHLIGSINKNINLDGSRSDPTRGNIKPYSSSFDSYFDALEVSLQQRPAPWGLLRLSYTFSKSINNISEFFFSAPTNNFNLREDRSRGDDDQRHRLVFDAALTSSSRPVDSLAGRLTHRWRLAGILQFYSALPFNIITGGNTKQATAQRPCAPGSGYSLTPGGTTNPCTEALPGAVIGRNAGIGFDSFTLNSRLSRSVALTDRIRLEGLIEAFNALNHRNNLIPNATFGTGAYTSPSTNAAFAQPSAVGDPRSLQLSLRLSF